MNEKHEVTSAVITDRAMEILQFDHNEFYGVDGIIDVFTKDNRILAFGKQNEEGEYALLEAYFMAKGETGIVTTEDASEINFISQLVGIIDAGVAESIEDPEMLLQAVRDEFQAAAEAHLDMKLIEEPKMTR